MIIDSEADNISTSFGRKLENRRDRACLNQILGLSRRHSHACSEAVRLFPIESILMVILLERQKIIEKIITDKSVEIFKLHEYIEK